MSGMTSRACLGCWRIWIGWLRFLLLLRIWRYTAGVKTDVVLAPQMGQFNKFPWKYGVYGVKTWPV